MRTLNEIRSLLDKLEQQPAATFELEDVVFLTLEQDSALDAQATLLDRARGLSERGGGTIVLGVKPDAVGRKQAIVGVPQHLQFSQLEHAVRSGVGPGVTVQLKLLPVAEGTGAVLVIEVSAEQPSQAASLPPSEPSSQLESQAASPASEGQATSAPTDAAHTAEAASPVFLQANDAVEPDFTARSVPGDPQAMISSEALKRLRELARQAQAPESLLALSDLELLTELGLIRQGHLLRAGLLLAGTEDAIARHFPGYGWVYMYMLTEAKCTKRLGGPQAIPLAMSQILDRIMLENPVATVPGRLMSMEIRTYPVAALEAALLNAFMHADYEFSGLAVHVKHFRDRIEIANRGSLPGGIGPANIWRHEPVRLNLALATALARLGLADRRPHGVRLMYESLLVEGKQPPQILVEGGFVRVVLTAQELSIPFRIFVADMADEGHALRAEELLIIRVLFDHTSIGVKTAAYVTQQSEDEARETLIRMERELKCLERVGQEWKLPERLERRLKAPNLLSADYQTRWELAKELVLEALRDRARKGLPGLSNEEVRAVTRLDRFQVLRLMRELKQEKPGLRMKDGRRWARYYLLYD